MMTDNYLTPEEASKYSKIPLYRLKLLRQSGTGPLFVRVSPKVVRYSKQELDRWVMENLKND